MSALADRGYPPSDHVRLPDQVDILHGPADVLAPFILLADRLTRERGVRLSISTDFDELLALNAANVATWGPVFPGLHPRYHGFDDRNAFWLRGIDDRGDVVLTRACRLMHLTDTTLHDELESLRLLYGAAMEAAAPDERCTCGAGLASQIRGVVCLQGWAWHHPSIRGRGLSAISTRLTKAIGLARWDVEEWTGLVAEHVAESMIRTYGVTQSEAGVTWVRNGVTVNASVIRMTRDEFLDDIRQWLARRSQDASGPPRGA